MKVAPGANWRYAGEKAGNYKSTFTLPLSHLNTCSRFVFSGSSNVAAWAKMDARDRLDRHESTPYTT